MVNRSILSDVDIRYGKKLYYHYESNCILDLFLGYSRIGKNIIKYAIFLFLFDEKLSRSDKISIFETENQFRALQNFSPHFQAKLDIRHWRFRNFFHLLLNIILFFAYPLLFIQQFKYRKSVIARCSGFLDIWLGKRFITKVNFSKLYVFNDHNGFCFVLARLIYYDNLRIKVTFVAHAPAKEDFPKITLITYMFYQDDISIYKKLCLNPNVEIKLLTSTVSQLHQEVEKDTLINLSHPFPFIEIMKLRMKLTGQIRLRFHPSDNFKKIFYSLFKTDKSQHR